MGMTFETDQPVMFQHCDPAGIVFYPRYFEMINATVERWFAEALDWPFAQLHGPDGLAAPMASMQVDFLLPSRLGDVLTWRLAPKRLGGSSLEIAVDARAGDQARLRCAATLVLVRMDTKRPTRWPDWVRERVGPLELAES